jgi:hypothetical protein
MANWQLTKGLQSLRAQVNEAFPGRDTTSDGTVGDKAHQAETSGHNPDDTAGSRPEWDGDDDANAEVRAWDMDSDLRAAPATAQQVVDHIRHLPGVSSVLRYMIYNRKIYQASNGWYPQVYSGASAHTEHIHFSGARTQAADNNTTFDYRLEEIPVALTGADKTWITQQIAAMKAEVVAAVNGVDEAVWGTKLQRPGEAAGKTTTAGAYQSYNDVVNRDTANAAAAHVLEELGPKLDQLLAAVAPPPAKP